MSPGQSLKNTLRALNEAAAEGTAICQSTAPRADSTALALAQPWLSASSCASLPRAMLPSPRTPNQAGLSHTLCQDVLSSVQVASTETQEGRCGFGVQTPLLWAWRPSSSLADLSRCCLCTWDVSPFPSRGKKESLFSCTFRTLKNIQFEKQRNFYLHSPFISTAPFPGSLYTRARLTAPPSKEPR